MVGRRELIRRGVGAAAAAVLADAVDARELNSRSGEVVIAKRALILLDRSGSMNSVRQATIDGLNAFLDEQRDKPDLYLTLIQFDSANGFEHLDITETFVDVPAPDAPRLTLDDYVPRGGTPLCAAVVHAIDLLEKQSGSNGKQLLVIQTDGEDTSSPDEIKKEVVKNQIATKETLGNWTFVFLGADIDAWGEASDLGISAAANTKAYSNTYAGTVASLAATSSGVASWYHDNSLSTSSFYTSVANSNVVDPIKLIDETDD